MVLLSESLSEDIIFVLRHADVLIEGAKVTLNLAVASIAFGFILGLILAVMMVYGSPKARQVASGFGILFRSLPLIIILIYVYFVFSFPNAFWAAVIGIGLRSAAYQAQIFRGSLETINESQMQAARSVGLTRNQALRHVIVPQALRRSLPSFQNEVAIVIKDTSIAFVIGLSELLTRTYDLFVQQTTGILEIIVAMSVIYFVLVKSANKSLEVVNDHYAIPGEN